MTRHWPHQVCQDLFGAPMAPFTDEDQQRMERVVSVMRFGVVFASEYSGQQCAESAMKMLMHQLYCNG
eukprot:1166134-Alexandrium_andersonii.AAC.1